MKWISKWHWNLQISKSTINNFKINNKQNKPKAYRDHRDLITLSMDIESAPRGFTGYNVLPEIWHHSNDGGSISLLRYCPDYSLASLFVQESPLFKGQLLPPPAPKISPKIFHNWFGRENFGLPFFSWFYNNLLTTSNLFLNMCTIITPYHWHWTDNGSRRSWWSYRPRYGLAPGWQPGYQ